MAMDSELADALASDPAYTETLEPPEGVSLPTFARQQSKLILSPFSKYYGERLPPGMLRCLDEKDIMY